MEAVQKFSTFSDLKNAEEGIGQPLFSDEVRHFIELMRQGEIPVEQKR